MKPLIPDTILDNFEKGQISGSFEAFTLLIDLSGFTAMTEALLRHGTHGAERLSNILNSIFEPLVDLVYAHGGFIPCFAGDAFNAIFPKTDTTADELLWLARDFIGKFEGRHFSDEFEIRCKIGLSFGLVEWGIVGKTLRSYYYRGPAVEGSVEGQMRAGAQQIIADENFIAMLGQHSGARNLGDGFFLFEYIIQEGKYFKEISAAREYAVEAYRQFIPQPVLEFNQSGEFRDIVAVFISLRGTDTNESLAVFAAAVLQLSENYSGYFKEIEFGDKGAVMPVVFGAPLSWENNTERALGFALSVLESSEAIPGVSVGIGIGSGLAYTGIIGGKRRCQYAAVGSRVNLASRLMAAAPDGQIYTDEASCRCAGFAFSNLGKLQYKGISDETSTFRLLRRGELAETSYDGPVAGRMEELALLQTFATPLLENRFAGIALISGEPGIGKSRLCHELKNALCGNHDMEYVLCLSDQILKKPFNPLVYALRNAFGQSGDRTYAENSEIFDRHFGALLNSLLESTGELADAVIRELLRTRSVLAGLSGIQIENSLWTQLDAKGRHENTKSAILNYFCARALLKPLIIEFEDWHWVDEETRSLLPDFIERLKQLPVLLLITSRYNDNGSKPVILPEVFYENNGIRQLTIDLSNLNQEAIRQMAEVRLGGRIDDAFLDFLQRSGNGNPFYTEQTLEYFSESALLEKTDGNWNIWDKTLKMSGSVNSVLMARVDRLPYPVKETIKAAAVIGREFEIPVLSEIMRRQHDFAEQNKNPQELLQEQVQTAERSQIWRPVSDIRYIFKHSLLREAVYDMQLGSRLKALHKLIAEAIVHVYGYTLEERFADLAFHYEQAGEVALTTEYLGKAADYACRNYQNAQALTYLEKLIAIHRKRSNNELIVSILLNKGEVEQLMGSWKAAETSFSAALKISLKSGEHLLSGRSRNALGTLLMMKGDYTQARCYFEDALQTMRQLQNGPGISKSLEGLGNLGFRQGDYESAKSHFLQSINILHQSDDTIINPQLVANLGLTYMNLNKYDEGVAVMQQHLPITESRNDRQGLAFLHTHLGIVYYEKGDYDAALLHYLDGLALSEELGNKFLESIALGGTGCIYEVRGEFSKAKSYFEEDLKLAQSLGDRQGMAIAYGLLGGHFVLTGDFDTALLYLEPNLKLCEELGYRKGLIRSLNTLAEIAFYSGNYTEAILYYQRSIAASGEIDNKLLQGIAMIDLCYIFLQTGELEKAAQLHREMEEHRKIVTKKTFHFRYMLLSAALCNVRHEKEEAAQILQDALKQHQLSAEEEAAVYDQLSAVFPNSDELKNKAISCYRSLYEKTPKYLYRHRMGKLSGEAS